MAHSRGRVQAASACFVRSGSDGGLLLSPPVRDEKTSTDTSGEDHEQPEPNGCLEMEPQKMEVTAIVVLENEQQCSHHNDGRDDLFSGGMPSLFRRRI